MISIKLTVAMAKIKTAMKVPNDLRGGNPNTQVVRNMTNSASPSLVRPTMINGKLLAAKSAEADCPAAINGINTRYPIRMDESLESTS